MESCLLIRPRTSWTYLQPTNMKGDQTKIVFFGTEPLAKDVLQSLKDANLTPSLIVSGQDTFDSKKNLVQPVEKTWAIENNIPVIQPKKLDQETIARLKEANADVFVVASYGKILPQALLALPKRGVVNLHPSLLPELRGPSPIRSAILNDMRETGVSIMLLDEAMDHGPILANKLVDITPWPIPGRNLDSLLSKEGAELLALTLPKWIKGEIEPKEQDHTKATYCKEFTKSDGEIDLNNDQYQNYLKICALDGWPGSYFFITQGDKQIRIKITEAEFKDNKLIIKKVIPEGKKEMTFEDFKRGYKQ